MAVAGAPTAQQLAQLPELPAVPLQSFRTAERAAQQGLEVVRGWAIYERHDVRSCMLELITVNYLVLNSYTIVMAAK